MRNILINFRAGLGDFLQITPLLFSLHKHSEFNLIFVGNAELKYLVDSYPFFIKSIYINYDENPFGKIISLVKLIYFLRINKVDIVFTPVFCAGTFSNLISILSGAPKRFGFANKNKAIAYTKTIPINNKESNIIQNLKVLDYLSVLTPSLNTIIYISEDANQRAETYFKRNGIFNAPIYAVAPLTKGIRGYPSKCWSFNKYRLVIDKLLKALPGYVLILGSPKEVEEFKKDLKSTSEGRILFQPNDFSIIDAAALLKKCRLLLCNDGGLMHIAAGVNIPIVSIWGPTSPNNYGYLFKENFFAIRSNYCTPCREHRNKTINCSSSKCLDEVVVDEVFHRCIFTIQNFSIRNANPSHQ